ncbi:MAG: four helix bundle protein [Candidatus Omnitrophica bacterium]|nr:four helix bundle protein [Candidatus Omnitrophota bacterium]
MKTYRDLLVWQKSMNLVTAVYQITKILPKDEKYGLISQIRRCAVSIPSNIAEGYGRKSKDDYLRFLQIAISSLYELQTQIEITFNLKYLSQDKFKEIHELSREIERMLSSLCRKINIK